MSHVSYSGEGGGLPILAWAQFLPIGKRTISANSNQSRFKITKIDRAQLFTQKSDLKCLLKNFLKSWNIKEYVLLVFRDGSEKNFNSKNKV